MSVRHRSVLPGGGGPEIDQKTSDDVLSFLSSYTNGSKPYTKRVRYSHLSAFFNFFHSNIDLGIGNPCDTSLIRKLYRERLTHKNSWSTSLILNLL
jgi:hypothetical protein